MNAYPPMYRRRRMALAASACIASLSLLAGVLLLFEQRAEVLWAGLEAPYADQAAACVAAADGAGRCSEQLALAPPAQADGR